MIIRVTDVSAFENAVFGADDLIEIIGEDRLEEGFEVEKRGDDYYVTDGHGSMLGDTVFFTASEFELCMEEVEL